MESRKECIVTTGGFGSGKSTFVSTYARPSEMDLVFAMDAEGSLNRVFDQLGLADRRFGEYVDLRDRFPDLDNGDILAAINRGELPWVDGKKGKSLADYWDFVMDTIDSKLKPGRFKYLIFDPLETMEASMVSKVDLNKRDFGVSSTAYGALYTAGVYPLYEQFFNAIWARGVDTILLTSHLKTPWEGTRKVTGKYTMSGKSLLYKLSTFMVWLKKQRGKRGAPIGLVLKERFVNLSIGDDDEWNIQARLPERIPQCTWRIIRKYLSGELVAGEQDGETMTDEERELISPLLKDKQLELMIAETNLETAQAQAEAKRATAMLPTVATQMPVIQKADDADPIVERIQELSLDKSTDEIDAILVEEGFKRPHIIRAFKLFDNT